MKTFLHYLATIGIIIVVLGIIILILQVIYSYEYSKEIITGIIILFFIGWSVKGIKESIFG